MLGLAQDVYTECGWDSILKKRQNKFPFTGGNYELCKQFELLPISQAVKVAVLTEQKSDTLNVNYEYSFTKK